MPLAEAVDKKQLSTADTQKTSGELSSNAMSGELHGVENRSASVELFFKTAFFSTPTDVLRFSFNSSYSAGERKNLASKAYGKNPAYIGNFNTLFRINSIYDMCRLADVNIEYVLTGKNKSNFIPVEITYKNILK